MMEMLEKAEILTQYRGVCPYCGQVAMVRGGKGLTEDAINHMAMMECDCEEATLEQNIERKKTVADANITTLLKEDGKEIVEGCKALTRSIAQGKIQKASFVTDNGIKISMEGREKSIRITRQEVIRRQMED